jgi:hypothetical protein
MMTTRSMGLLSVALTAAVVATPLLASPAAPSAAAACTASPTWVTAPSLPSFATPPTNHCAFYQIAWQSFLYLTSPKAGPGSPAVFETYPTTDDVFGGGSLAKAPQGLRLVTATDPRTQRKRVFRPRIAKPAPKRSASGALTFDEDQQAGSGGILVDQAGNITYYEQFLDPSAFVPFVQSCDLNVQACQSQRGAQSLALPVGSMEMKVSWRPLWKTSANVNSYYLIPGAPVQNAQGQTVTPDYFGLVGFHVVYAIAGHPELVWATFEHVDNAPNAPCVSGQQTCRALPAGFSGWAYNDCTSTSCANVNAWPTPPPSPLPDTQAFREYLLGTMPRLKDAAGVPGASNIKIIAGLNQSVRGILPKGSVWANYFLGGAVWTTGSLPAFAAFQASGQTNPAFNEVGSTFLANATMETFTQFPNPVPMPYPNPVQSCFTCHNTADSTQTQPPPTQAPEFLLSHAFFQASGNSCPWNATPPAACTATQAKK